MEDHTEEGAAALLNLSFVSAITSFDAAIALNSSSYPKQWMRGIALFFVERYKDGAHQFTTNLKENPHDVEEVVWACMCNMKRVGLRSAQSLLLPCPNQDLRLPMREIYNLFAGRGNIADVLHRKDDDSSIAYGHLYVALYLDCLIQAKGIGLSEASRRHYHLAGKKPTNDFMGKLSSALTRLVPPSPPSTTTTIATHRQTFLHSDFSGPLVGCWQLSAGHHDDVPSQEELHRRLTTNIEQGFTTLDMGDIYTGVEEAVGIYRTEQQQMTDQIIEIHTKLVPDLKLLSTWSTELHTIPIVRRSVNRVQIRQLDMVQFHWWDWSIGNHVEAYRGLCSLVPSMIKSVGVTNYDAEHLQELLTAGLPVVSNQVQYSLLDRRVETTMTDICTEHNVRLLCYGVLCGGFLSNKWLGISDPIPTDAILNSETLSKYLTNRSLIKYYLVIREFGGWTLFQNLLRILKIIADRHQGENSVATVSCAWVLSRRRVGGVILGLSGNERHLESASRAHRLAYQLDEKDFEMIDAHHLLSHGPLGPFYQLERNRSSLHGKIMRYNCGELHTNKHVDEFLRRVTKITPAAKPWLIRSLLLEATGFEDERQKMIAPSVEKLTKFLGTELLEPNLLSTVDNIIQRFGLQPHPEGGHYTETYRGSTNVNAAWGDRSSSTAIFFLITPGSVSRLHRILSDEVWHFYLGGPMTILEISEEGILTETVLGQNIMANEQVQYVVKANTWFGSFPNNGTAFSFVGCTVGTWFEHALLSFFPSCLSLSELTHGHLFVFSSLFPMLDACFRLLFIVYCLLFIVHCSLFIVYCLLFIVYCLLYLLIGIFFSTWICL